MIIFPGNCYKRGRYPGSSQYKEYYACNRVRSYTLSRNWGVYYFFLYHNYLNWKTKVKWKLIIFFNFMQQSMHSMHSRIVISIVNFWKIFIVFATICTLFVFLLKKDFDTCQGLFLMTFFVVFIISMWLYIQSKSDTVQTLLVPKKAFPKKKSNVLFNEFGKN